MIRRAYTLTELMAALVILAVLSLLAIPVFSHVLGNSQNTASEILLLHLDQEAFTLAAADGDVYPTYADVTAAAGDVYYGVGTETPLTVTTPAGSASTSYGSVSVTIDGSGATETIGLAMVGSGSNVSVAVHATATPGAAPADWTCATTTASSVAAAQAVGGC